MAELLLALSKGQEMRTSENYPVKTSLEESEL